jgi:hypothetical protein
MTDAYQNRIATAVPRLRYGAIGSGSFHDLQRGFLACMNDILNGGGAEDFLHWAVPGEHAVLDAVEESAGLPKELLARSRAKLRRRSRACCSKQRAGKS